MKGFARKNYAVWIFLLLQTVLYLSFLILDLTGGSVSHSVGIKYTMILLCFCYALLTGGACKSILFLFTKTSQSSVSQRLLSILRKYRDASTLLLQAGLFFTLISDLFILILDLYVYGVFTFIIVQQLYSLRLIILHNEMHSELVVIGRRENVYKIFILYTRRLSMQAGTASVIYLFMYLADINIDILSIISVFYFISILSNTITAIQLFLHDRQKRSNLLYAAGMLLFLLCDINVGLFNMSGFIAMPKEIYSVIYSFSSILMWTFYAPSQVLIALASHVFKKN
jgi:hypothetical protein